MKPTSEQTRKGVLSAVPSLMPEDLKMRSLFRYNPTGPSRDALAASHPASVDPSTAYGCVDWFIYPDAPKAAHV
jgi:hypothetical protein